MGIQSQISEFAVYLTGDEFIKFVCPDFVHLVNVSTQRLVPAVVNVFTENSVNKVTFAVNLCDSENSPCPGQATESFSGKVHLVSCQENISPNDALTVAKDLLDKGILTAINSAKSCDFIKLNFTLE